MLPLYATISFFKPTNRFSIVVVSFHCFSKFKFYTFPLFWFTEGIFIFVMNCSVGGLLGYSGGHSMAKL